jgi:hypothetical protein
METAVLLAELKVLEREVSRAKVAVVYAREVCRTARDVCQRADMLRREARGIRDSLASTPRRPAMRTGSA